MFSNYPSMPNKIVKNISQVCFKSDGGICRSINTFGSYIPNSFGKISTVVFLWQGNTFDQWATSILGKSRKVPRFFIWKRYESDCSSWTSNNNIIWVITSNLYIVFINNMNDSRSLNGMEARTKLGGRSGDKLGFCIIFF